MLLTALPAIVAVAGHVRERVLGEMPGKRGKRTAAKCLMTFPTVEPQGRFAV